MSFFVACLLSIIKDVGSTTSGSYPGEMHLSPGSVCVVLGAGALGTGMNAAGPADATAVTAGKGHQNAMTTS